MVAMSLTIIFAYLRQFIILKIWVLFWPYHIPFLGSKTLLNMHGEIKSNKKRHCAHTHMICAEVLIWGRKWESGELLCSKWSQGAWTFQVWAHAARLLWRVLWGKATSDIMKHSLTGRLSSLLSLTSSCIEQILTEAFLQLCTMPELRGEIWEGKHLTQSCLFLGFLFFTKWTVHNLC